MLCTKVVALFHTAVAQDEAFFHAPITAVRFTPDKINVQRVYTKYVMPAYNLQYLDPNKNALQQYVCLSFTVAR